MAAEARLEELEVLESILDTDFQRISDDELTVRVEPEEGSTSEPMELLLRIQYTPAYPDELPDMSIEVAEEGAEEDQLTDEDKDTLLRRLKETGEDSIGMAMVYTLAMQLKESLTELLVAKASARELEDQAEQLRIQEVELAKPKGTPVTLEAFLAWRRKFEVEAREKRRQEEADEIKALPLKERREKEAIFQRLTGKQIFLQKKGVAGDDDETEEGEMLDLSKYEREQRDREEEEEENGIVLSDSD